MAGHDSLRPGNPIKPGNGQDKFENANAEIRRKFGESGVPIAEGLAALKEHIDKSLLSVRADASAAKTKAAEAARSVESAKRAAADVVAQADALGQLKITTSDGEVFTGQDALTFMVTVVNDIPNAVKEAVDSNLSIVVEEPDESGEPVEARKTGIDALIHILETAETAKTAAGDALAVAQEAKHAAANAAGDALAGFSEDALQIVAESKRDIKADVASLGTTITNVAEALDAKITILLNLLQNAGAHVDKDDSELIGTPTMTIIEGDKKCQRLWMISGTGRRKGKARALRRGPGESRLRRSRQRGRWLTEKR
jgi:hypothetical protein